MKELTQSRVASALMVLLGAWLAASPIWISITGAALVNIYIVGGVIAAAGLVQFFWRNSTLPSFLVGLTVVWLFIAAFAFTVSNAVAWNQVLSAVAGFILATWDGFELSEYKEHHITA